MDPLKNRVGAFTESISIMSCPVLVAVAVMRVDLRREGNAAVRDHVSPIAAACLVIMCSVTSLFLAFASLPDDFFNVHSRLWIFAFCSSKLVVFCCTILQMVLALLILLLISMDFKAYMAVPIVFGIIICVIVLYFSWRTQEVGNRKQIAFDDELEWSLDLSAAVTSLLFLGMEALALEGLSPDIGPYLKPRLRYALPVAYVACVVAISVMACMVVPPCDFAVQVNKTRSIFVHILACLVTMCLPLVVGAILCLLFGIEEGIVTVAAPLICAVFVLALCGYRGGSDKIAGEKLRPASLELTKVTFTAFLAVSLPSLGDDPVSSSTKCFIISSAVSVLCGLAWRFSTHFNRKAAARTANVACAATHLSLAVAAIYLAVMGKEALQAHDDECQIPCTNSTSLSAQLQSFTLCLVGNSRQNTSYKVSSVKC